MRLALRWLLLYPLTVAASVVALWLVAAATGGSEAVAAPVNLVAVRTSAGAAAPALAAGAGPDRGGDAAKRRSARKPATRAKSAAQKPAPGLFGKITRAVRSASSKAAAGNAGKAAGSKAGKAAKTGRKTAARRPSVRVEGCRAPSTGASRRCAVTKIARSGARSTARCTVPRGHRGCRVSAAAGGARSARVSGSCDRRGRCHATERTRRGSSVVRFAGDRGRARSTLGVGSRCSGSGCLGVVRTRARYVAGHARASCVGNCTVHARSRGTGGVRCTDGRRANGCRTLVVRTTVSGDRTGARSACGSRGVGRCTARASLRGSASCTSHGPQCRTKLARKDGAGRNLTSGARCSQHGSGRCSAVSGQRHGYASTCRGRRGHTFCRTRAAGPPGRTTAASRQTRGAGRATSDPHATSTCSGRGRTTTCESEATAPRGVPTRSYCHSVGRGGCATDSRVTRGSTCAGAGRVATYCMSSGPRGRGKHAATTCAGRGAHRCRPEAAEPGIAAVVRSCAAAPNGRSARCATTSTARSVAGPHDQVGARQPAGPVPEDVVRLVVPAGTPAADRQRRARAELTELMRGYRRSGEQLNRLEREGSAVRAMAGALKARGGVTRRQAAAVHAAKARQRPYYTEQLYRFASLTERLDEVARAAGPSERRDVRAPWTSSLPPRPVVVGVALDALGNSRRSVSTFGDAADRHRWKADRLRASDPVAAARQDRLAAKYQALSDRMRGLTEGRRPFRWSTRLQGLLASAPADVLPKSNPTVRTLRRAATKVGWSSVVGAGVDVVDAINTGKSVPHTVAKDGTVIGASSAAGGLTAAGVAALGGPPGWAVAAGIVVSTGIAWAVSESGAADWAADKITGLFK